MGFLQTLLFYRTTKRGEDDHHGSSSSPQTHSESSQVSQVDPITPKSVEDGAHDFLPADLELKLACSMIRDERISTDTTSCSESTDVKKAVVRNTQTNQQQEDELERYTTATSEDPQTVQRPSTEPNTSVVSSPSTFKSADLRQRTSRGFGALRTVLRHRRPLPKESTARTIAETAKFVDDGVKSPVCSNAYISDKPSNLPTTCNDELLMATSATKEDLRKVSDQTVQTEITATSRITVCRWPSRHVTTPIATVDPNDLLPGVSEHQESTRTSISAEVHRPVLHSHPPRPPSSEYSVHPSFRDLSRTTQTSETSRDISIDLANLSSEMLSQRLFSDMGSQFRQQQAIREFNNLASCVKFEPLILKECNALIDDDSPASSEKPIKYRDSILRKIRSMRSTLRLRRSNHNGPTLRRMKTLTCLSGKYYEMNSLRGKRLEILARLGGYSFLTFPPAFAPATMKLPACIVATISYLKTYAPQSRNAFVDSGDLSVAARIYDHFAEQVLSVEREEHKVDITMRGSEFPSETLGLDSESESFLRGRFHVLSVACVFKQLLAGLPGGILGSIHLYRNLVNISTHQFPDEVAPALNREYRVSFTSAAKSRAIALAIVALTSDMQLDLICAVFGLCAFLDHEAHCVVDFYRRKRIPSIALTGLLDRDRLIQVFTPLLLGYEEGTMDREVDAEAALVMKMMIECWRGVSKQLWIRDV